jgi:hypothetical protein
MLKGDPDTGGMLKETTREVLASLLPGHKDD